MNTGRIQWIRIRVQLAMLVCCLLAIGVKAQVGKIGINTNVPAAMLHVKDSSVVFSAASVSAGAPPISGPGIRMMWYPQRAAFRVGLVTGLAWNKDSIGEASFASGFNTLASDKYATAIGSIARATGENSIALGRLVNAEANSAIAIGLESSAYGVGSVALGSYNSVVDADGIAIGSGNTAYSSNTTAIGLGNFAGSPNSTAIGEGNASYGFNSLAMGYYTSADAYRQVTVGSWNSPSFIEDPENWVLTDPIFVVGNGEDDSNLSTAMTVLKNGNVGVGISDPEEKFEVDGSTRFGINGTPIQEIIKVVVTHDIQSIAAGGTVTETFTINNVAFGSTVYVSPQGALLDGIIIAYARVSNPATDAVEVKFSNITTSPINPGSMDFYVTVIR